MWHGKSKSLSHTKAFHILQEETRGFFEKSGLLPCFEHPSELKILRWLRNSCGNLKSMTVNCFLPMLDGKHIASLRR